MEKKRQITATTPMAFSRNYNSPSYSADIDGSQNAVTGRQLQQKSFNSGVRNQSKPLKSFESWFGFVKEKSDAVLLVEAVIAGFVKPLKIVPADAQLRSGSVIVFAESSMQTQITRWRDGESWSSSRIQGHFLLYREVESAKLKTTIPFKKEKSRFTTTTFRQNSRPVSDGFAKRTITLIGSDNNKYRVISYFFPHDVAHLYGDDLGYSSVSKADKRKLDEGEILATPSGTPLILPTPIQLHSATGTPRWSPAPTECMSSLKRRREESDFCNSVVGSPHVYARAPKGSFSISKLCESVNDKASCYYEACRCGGLG
ncbi:hypothetical protein HK100_009283, partial [Physocladia obscura]